LTSATSNLLPWKRNKQRKEAAKMTEVKIVGGKLTVNKTATAKGNGKPAKYPYPQAQYDQLLKLAKTAGLEANSKAQKTKAVNSVTRAVLDEFIATQNKPKTQ